ncbi:MAG: hypothetical protein J6U54_09270 [Clostridiales bacterium]|nr:hypothetical protein [Clostridiales bacterium]
MILLPDMSINIRGFIALCFFVQLLADVYDIIICVEIKKKLQAFISFVLFGISLLFYLLTIMNELLADVASKMPFIIFPISLLVVTAVTSIHFLMINRERKTTLTIMSVKEGFDSLPMGICHYMDDGLPRMTNNKMNEICQELSGSQIRNGKRFWERLSKQEYKGVIRGGDHPIVQIDDKTYSFSNNSVDTAHGQVMEITCTDVSEEMKLTRELEEKLEAEKAINLRLKSLINTIEYVTMNKELLRLKTRLHDDLGKGLLLAKCYTFTPTTEMKDEMLKVWKESLKMLVNNEDAEWLEPYYVVKKHASLLGITIDLKGQLPVEEQFIPIVEAILTTHVTNVMRHAEGKTAFITSVKEGNNWIIEASNDGKKPESEVKEQGGLKNLRKEIERIGGTMKITSTPEFKITVNLPGGGS